MLSWENFTNLLQISLLILNDFKRINTQPATSCSKLTIERLEQRVKYVQS